MVIRDSVKSHCTYCRVMSFFNLKTDQTGRRCACFRTYGSQENHGSSAYTNNLMVHRIRLGIHKGGLKSQSI